MLEVLYDTRSNLVLSWCGDPDQFGNFTPGENQAVIILPLALSDIPPCDWYIINPNDHTLTPNPNYQPPVPFDVREEVRLIKERLALLEQEQGINH